MAHRGDSGRDASFERHVAALAEPRRRRAGADGVNGAARPSVDVSVIVPIRNEARHVEETLHPMLAQRFDGNVEFLLVDGDSDDGTTELLHQIAGRDPRCCVLRNPARRTPQALNVGLRAARGDYIVRMDAHTFFPSDYVQRGVDRLSDGGVMWVTGPALPRGEGRWSRRVELALRSWLGVGGAAYRKPARQEVELDTGFAGVMRRDTLEQLGGWDERWPINQDSELAARVRERGGTIVCVPEMAAGYVPRNSLPGLARQYFWYGHYRQRTAIHHPISLRTSHLLAPALVFTTIGAGLARGRDRTIAQVALAAYVGALAAASARHLRDRPTDGLLLPAVFVTMHYAWGFGFITGTARHGFPARAIREAIKARVRKVRAGSGKLA